MKLRHIVGLVVTLAMSSLMGHVHARNPLGFLQTSNYLQPKAEYRPRTLSHEESLALYSRQQKERGFAACADQFPDRTPLSNSLVSPEMKPIALCSNHFAVMYSGKSKTPLVVVERLNKEQLSDAKGEERTNQFYPDPRLRAGERAELSDYRGSGNDRGHNCPAADEPDSQSMAQSFALSNMMPQNPNSNQKAWSAVESATRKFVQRANGDVFVFTGPLFDAGYETIGDNKVWKPTRIYKLVYDESSGRAWAYILPNAPDVRVERPMDYAAFVKATGLPLLGSRRISGSVK